MKGRPVKDSDGEDGGRSHRVDEPSMKGRPVKDSDVVTS